MQVQLRLEPTIGSDREAPTFRAFVRSQNGKDMLLSTIQGQGCELRLDGVTYQYPSFLTGVAYKNVKLWKYGLPIQLDGQWTTAGGKKHLELTPGKHTVQFAWAGYHPGPVTDGLAPPDRTRPVLLVSNPVEFEMPGLSAPTNPAADRPAPQRHPKSHRMGAVSNECFTMSPKVESAASIWTPDAFLTRRICERSLRRKISREPGNCLPRGWMRWFR